MQIRARAKRFLYGRLPFARGSFPYYGCRVFFPKHSLVFERACFEGIYEQDVVKIVSALVRPETTYIDVGANIGLLSIPILAVQPDVSVISIEASPVTLSYLERTRSVSKFKDRWAVVGTAAGRTSGSATFWTAAARNGAFDGLMNTGRGGESAPTVVQVQPLDQIWLAAGRPNVSAVKLDVEGGELDVIRGARELIDQCHPTFVIEWSGQNLPSYGITPGQLLDVCREIGYRAYAHPQLARIDTEPLLRVAMALTETFVLASE